MEATMQQADHDSIFPLGPTQPQIDAQLRVRSVELTRPELVVVIEGYLDGLALKPEGVPYDKALYAWTDAYCSCLILKTTS
jgi:hypothetical protein